MGGGGGSVPVRGEAANEGLRAARHTVNGARGYLVDERQGCSAGGSKGLERGLAQHDAPLHTARPNSVQSCLALSSRTLHCLLQEHEHMCRTRCKRGPWTIHWLFFVFIGVLKE